MAGCLCVRSGLLQHGSDCPGDEGWPSGECCVPLTAAVAPCWRVSHVDRQLTASCWLPMVGLCLQLFFLPWEGSTICGTTDSTSDLTMLPKPTEEEVHFILEESNRCGMCESWTFPSVGAQSRTVLSLPVPCGTPFATRQLGFLQQILESESVSG